MLKTKREINYIYKTRDSRTLPLGLLMVFVWASAWYVTSTNEENKTTSVKQSNLNKVIY